MIKDWEKEFDKEFPFNIWIKYDANIGKNLDKSLKQFISNLLIQEKKQLLDEIEKEFMKWADGDWIRYDATNRFLTNINQLNQKLPK